MRTAVLVVAFAACGPPKLAYWTGASEQGDWARPARPRYASDGDCRATLHVRVVDDTGAPIAGAEVILQQSQHLAAPSTVHTDILYQTDIVRTNARGEAVTCNPDDVPKVKDMFGRVHDGRFLARLGNRTGSIPVAYADTPTIVLH